MKNNLKKKKPAYFYLAPYLLAMIIPLATLLTVHLAYSKVAYRQTDLITDYIRHSVSSHIGRIYGDIYNVHDFFYKKDTSNLFTPSDDPLHYYRSDEVGKFIMEMKSLNALLSDFQNIYLYIARDDVVLSSRGIESSKDFYDIHMGKNSSLSYEDWLLLVNDKSRVERFVPSAYPTGDQIIYSAPLVNYTLNNLDCSIGVIMLKDQFFIDAPFIEWRKNSATYIFNTNRSFLIGDVNNAIDLPYPCTINDILDLSGKYDGKYDIIQTDIRLDSLKYSMYTVLSQNPVTKSLKSIRDISMGIIMLNMVLSVIFLMYIVKNNYRPILKLSSALTLKGSERLTYRIIEGSVQELLVNNNELKNQVEHQKKFFQDNIINKLLKGEITDGLTFLLRHYDVKMPYEHFVVLALHTRRYDGTSHDPSEEVFRDTIKSTLKEAFEGGESVAFVTMLNEQFVCVINTAENDEAYLHRMAQIAAYCVNLLRTDFSYSMVLTLSRIHSGISEIPNAYFEAIEAVAEAQFDLNSRVIICGETKASKKNFLSPKDENEFLLHIQTGSTKAALEKMTSFFSSVSEVNMLATQNILYDTLCMIAKIPFIIDSVAKNDSLSKKMEFKSMLARTNSKEEILTYLESIITEACDTVNKITGENYKEILDAMLKFIHENHSAQDMSLQLISDRFRYSISFIHKLFSEYYNMTPASYINEYRINEAKKLLQQNVSISAAAQSTGFTNIRSFNRVFKKLTGVTPTEYKRQTDSKG